MFVATKHVFFRDRSMLVPTKHNLSQQNVCRGNHTFVATKRILVAAPANDIEGPAWTVQTRFRLPSEEEDIDIFF